VSSQWSDPIEGAGSAHDFATEAVLIAFYRGSEFVQTTHGDSRIHRFQKRDGENVDAWGSADLDAKLKNVVPGTLTRIEYTGVMPLPPKKGETEPRSMKVYTVRIDPTTVPTATAASAAPASADTDIPF
jgi:hypothetical protein